jgi:hypothetical protein
MRRRTVVLMALLIVLTAIPAKAGPPTVVEWPVVLTGVDFDEGIVTFWNITRDDLCDWFEGGMVGERRIEAPLPLSLKETGQGALVATMRAERITEVWHLGEGANICAATAGQSGPLASGRGLLVMTDNDFDVSGTRANAFGLTLKARMTGADGSTWHLRIVDRLVIHMSGDISESYNFRIFQTP